MQCREGYQPQGALRERDGSTRWRVWAPFSETVKLVLFSPQQGRTIALTPEGGGYYVHRESQAAEGLAYAFELADGGQYPDPASRWQPEGVHRPSALYFPESYDWSDQQWTGVAREDLVIYELHVGTFTPAGTFDAVVERLAPLSSLGVTALEIMPIAQFSGDRNWGYDGVHPYAVQNSYGGPRAFQRLVDAAHRARLAVVLDVVYNHVGPEGNYLGKFGPYFTDRYHTSWGNAVNYDGPDSDPVRQFVIDNACMWVRDFHVDGLRLDAVQTIYDFSPRHILADIQAAVQQVAARQNRLVHVIAETDQNDVRLVRPLEQGGYGLDGVWSDDFHHSVHSLLSGENSGYYRDFGRPEHLAKAFTDVFVYDGCFSDWRRRRHGTRAGAMDRAHFVVCLHNHDQVGNRAAGDRLGAIISPPARRLACGLLLLSPYVPLLFMGEEYGEDRPFPFFCSFGDPRLAEAVRRGRREEFAALAFQGGVEIPDPQSPETFASAKLQWSWPEGSPHAQIRRLYQDLLTARRQWPALRDRQHTTARLIGNEMSNDRDRLPLLFIERGDEDRLLAVANLGPQTASFPATDFAAGKLLLSTENVCYGGGRAMDVRPQELLPYELAVFRRGSGPDE